jgi:hypothetical protein
LACRKKYCASDQWKAPSVDTQKARRRKLERFRADHGDTPHNSMQAIHIKALMDKVEVARIRSGIG